MTESLAAQINGAMKSSTLSKQDNNGRGESSAKKRKRDDNEGANTPSLPEASEPAPHKAGQRIPTVCFLTSSINESWPISAYYVL